MVHEALSREIRSGLQWVMLYADDVVVVIAESLVELEERYLTWRTNIEYKCLKLNVGNTKIMKCDANEGPVFASGKYPLSVCKKEVGRNSVYYSFCKH